MVDIQAEAASAAPRYPRRPGRVALWALGAIAPALCLAVAVPAIAVTFLLAYPLLFAGPVVGVMVIAGGALRRHRVRRELAATGASLVAATPGSLDADAPGPVAADRIPESSDGSALRSATDRAADAELVARDATEFRLIRQTTLFVGYSVVAVLGILSGVMATLGGGDLIIFALSAFAFLGVTIACMAPAWALGRGVVVGEEHALLTRTGSWRLILALRVLALVVGGAATILAAIAALSLVLGSTNALWPF